MFCFQVAVTTFAVYVLTGHNLTASKAFVALSLFGIMRFPLGFFPDVISSCIQVGPEKKSESLYEGHARVLYIAWLRLLDDLPCLSCSTLYFPLHCKINLSFEFTRHSHDIFSVVIFAQ